MTFENKFNQLIRTSDKGEEGFQNPMTQVNRNRYLLKQWLEKYKYDHVLIESLVIISHPSTILKEAEGYENVKNHVIHSEHFLNWMERIEQAYTSPIFTEQQLNKLSKQMMKEHMASEPSLLPSYQINKAEIVKGVRCPNCSHIPMQRGYGRWICPACEQCDKNAHKEAINDFLLLIHPTINNNQCRDFLSLSSRYIAYQLLLSANLHPKGTKKSRNYSY